MANPSGIKKGQRKRERGNKTKRVSEEKEEERRENIQ
jgi:hypothetical protein